MTPADLLAAFGPADPLLVLVPALVVGLFLLLAMLVSGRASSAARMRRRIERAHATVGAEPEPPQPTLPATVRRQAAPTLLGHTGRNLSRMLPRAARLRLRLDQAGIKLGVIDFAAISALLGMTTAGSAWFMLGVSVPMGAGLGIIAAAGLPHFVLGRCIARRKRQFLAHFPEAIDLVVRGVRSGLPVAEALHATGEELANQVGTVLQEVTGNVRLGMALDEALAAAARRLEIQEFRFFVISLSVQQETGGNLTEILQTLGQVMRRREQLRLKVKAMSSEARASAMIIGSLPFIMCLILYLINPDYITKLFVDPRGWFMLAGGLTSLGLGLGIMAKMVRFEI